jgi:hypothetical protein
LTLAIDGDGLRLAFSASAWPSDGLSSMSGVVGGK